MENVTKNVTDTFDYQYDPDNFYKLEEARDFLTPPVLIAGYVCLGFACLGIGINVACFTIVYAMSAHGHIDSKASAFLIQQQAIADLLVCALTVAIAFYDTSSMNTESPWREMECYIWYSQFVYWWAMLLSAFNLCLISVDWLLEVCFSDKHAALRRILTWLLITIHVCAIAGALPCAFTQVIVPSGACRQPTIYNTFAMNAMFIGWMAAWVFFAYLFPIWIAAGCYGYMIYHYNKLIKTLPAGAERSEAEKELRHLFKCILSLVMFTLFVGFDSVDWLFDAILVADYVFNTPRQKFTVFLLSINSVSNPLIHVIFSPDVRSFLSRKKTTNVEDCAQQATNHLSDNFAQSDRGFGVDNVI